eukprot:CAMPEP_0173293028 /NCGR_PEP_ID=MMETSP1143-20121109/13064_1 /TAXON_ID=483371 /ORGANISM="non described non described, Strain CCMP2298" /LENGTH=160 /DNA_ID=CAMNT_0014232497 /DNA_START=448 /DNA_END=927 /DNA_ORIENTATION=-
MYVRFMCVLRLYVLCEVPQLHCAQGGPQQSFVYVTVQVLCVGGYLTRGVAEVGQAQVQVSQKGETSMLLLLPLPLLLLLSLLLLLLSQTKLNLPPFGLLKTHQGRHEVKACPSQYPDEGEVVRLTLRSGGQEPPALQQRLHLHLRLLLCLRYGVRGAAPA